MRITVENVVVRKCLVITKSDLRFSRGDGSAYLTHVNDFSRGLRPNPEKKLNIDYCWIKKSSDVVWYWLHISAFNNVLQIQQIQKKNNGWLWNLILGACEAFCTVSVYSM